MPFIIEDYSGANPLAMRLVENAGLSNVAASLLNLLGFEQPRDYDPSLVAVGLSPARGRRNTKRREAHMNRWGRWMWRAVVAVVLLMGGTVMSASGQEPLILEKDTGYRGIWYYNQETGDEYVYKYSGGLGTYCAKHLPLAVYAPEVNKTFFVYGGTRPTDRVLLEMVSFYDHDTGTVPRPTILLDKATADAHDNPVLSIDDEGYLWVVRECARQEPPLLHSQGQETLRHRGF